MNNTLSNNTLFVYEKQSEQWLNDTGSQLLFELSDIKPPDDYTHTTRIWVENCSCYITVNCGRHWTVTLKNKSGQYVRFDYYESIIDRCADALCGKPYTYGGICKPPLSKEDGWIIRKRYEQMVTPKYSFPHWRPTKGNPPTAYSILASLDTYCETDFNMWAIDFGYDTDSRKAYHAWQEMMRITLSLNQMYDADELQKLSEIC